ncbi:MP24 protein [Trypanosoma theileri]|uniref:MP24 protein n=1 Tax=Trypanosoma theileri TaxID=67003 RepID=A0A1X0P9K8_9TRYP|nr:MP24 protein [Trypanosoma theileri]ORC93140.1 MP24 protein [Trypanosoma theileri]
MFLRATSPLLDKTICTLRDAVGVACAAGLLGGTLTKTATPGASLSESESEDPHHVFASFSVADPLGTRQPSSVSGSRSNKSNGNHNNSSCIHNEVGDRIRFASYCVEGPSVAVSSAAASIAHIEGVVRRVDFGHAVGAEGRPLLQFVLDVVEAPPGQLEENDDDKKTKRKAREGAMVLPLAVWWRAAGVEGSTGAEEAARRLVGRRVVASGRLRVEERYEVSSRTTHKVPVLMLPPTPTFETSALAVLAD